MSLDANDKRTIAIVGGAFVLAALGLFGLMLARAAAFGPNNGPLGARGITVAGFLLGTVVLFCSAFAVWFGIKTIADYRRRGAEEAKRVRSRLESEYMSQRARQEKTPE